MMHSHFNPFDNEIAKLKKAAQEKKRKEAEEKQKANTVNKPDQNKVFSQPKKRHVEDKDDTTKDEIDSLDEAIGNKVTDDKVFRL